MDQKALPTLRRNLNEFINADPVMVSFARPAQVQNVSTGGWVRGAVSTLNPQQFRLVPFKRRMSDSIQNTQDGPLRLADYILVGRYNVDVEVGDEFTHNGLLYNVTEIEPKTDNRATTDRVTIALAIRD